MLRATLLFLLLAVVVVADGCRGHSPDAVEAPTSGKADERPKQNRDAPTTPKWREAAKLTASDGAAADGLGLSVSLSGDRAIVGTVFDDDNGDASGSAYIFERRADGTWRQAAKLTAFDGAEGDHFGNSVALSGDLAIVGAWEDDDNGDRSGSAYVFERGRDGRWRRAAKLRAADAAKGDSFGRYVSLKGDRAIVGADGDDDNGPHSGSAYVFERAANGLWRQAAKLRARDAAPGDMFGYSVSLTGDRAIVGAPGDSDKGIHSGSAYLFGRGPSGSWSQVAKLTASDGARNEFFGICVSLGGDRAIVGASGERNPSLLVDDSGSAYIFERGAGGSWTQVAKLAASDRAKPRHFGRSVSLSGGRAIVGARHDDVGGWCTGSAYIFERSADGSWPLAAKIGASDGAKGDMFGWSVSLGGDRALVGARNDNDQGEDSGSAYIFERGARGRAAARQR